jgi:hypothetical protein
LTLLSARTRLTSSNCPSLARAPYRSSRPSTPSTNTERTSGETSTAASALSEPRTLGVRRPVGADGTSKVHRRSVNVDDARPSVSWADDVARRPPALKTLASRRERLGPSLLSVDAVVPDTCDYACRDGDHHQVAAELHARIHPLPSLGRVQDRAFVQLLCVTQFGERRRGSQSRNSRRTHLPRRGGSATNAAGGCKVPASRTGVSSPRRRAVWTIWRGGSALEAR